VIVWQLLPHIDSPLIVRQGLCFISESSLAAASSAEAIKGHMRRDALTSAGSMCQKRKSLPLDIPAVHQAR